MPHKILNPHDQVYSDLLKDVIHNGRVREDRTGTGTKSVFGRQVRFDLTEGFPLLTGKQVSFKNIWSELLWFLQGKTDLTSLHEHGNHIWDEWANEDGDLGPVYGKMWRSWPISSFTSVDQIGELIEGLREKPFSRRHIVSGWNPALLPDEGASHAENVNNGLQALPPCHTLFQFYVSELTIQERFDYALKNRSEREVAVLKMAEGDWEELLDELQIPHRGLSCQLYQRSGDIFLGVPYNIASYALLTFVIAEILGMAAIEFVHTFGDLHLYLNHQEAAEEYLDQDHHPVPTLDIDSYLKSYIDVDELKMDDVKLVGYACGPVIKAPIAV